jgi:hypothetical protein
MAAAPATAMAVVTSITGIPTVATIVAGCDRSTSSVSAPGTACSREVTPCRKARACLKVTGHRVAATVEPTEVATAAAEMAPATSSAMTPTTASTGVTATTATTTSAATVGSACIGDQGRASNGDDRG